MKHRLIDLHQIREQKIARSRAWIYGKIAAGEFPKPLPLGNSSKNLWDESEVDNWLSEFVAKAKSAVHADSSAKSKRTTRATAVRARKRQAPAARLEA